MTILWCGPAVASWFRVVSVDLREPDKAFVEGYTWVTRSRARPLTVLWNRADNKSHEGVVDLQPSDDVLLP